MAIERTYTIPLRKEWQKAPRYRRAKKAVNAVKAFLIKHMKADEKNVKIGKYLNKELWKHGMKNPPCRIRINVKKDDKGIVTAELVGAPEEKKKEVKGKKKPAKTKEEKKTKEKSAPKIEQKKIIETPKAEESEPKVMQEKPKAKPVEKKEPKKT
ncbi:50S ribosomal protein L31e [Candidatus Woesearchaeota archaeon]|nr:50S ribosomal protein L31e [Candidatus Woesearchaeota archaeon]